MTFVKITLVLLWFLLLSNGFIIFRTLSTKLSLGVTSSAYLESIVARKRVEVDNLLRKHTGSDDPLIMRLSYIATSCDFNVTKALRRPGGLDDFHKMSVLVDVKRKSPTLPSQRNIVDFANTAKYCELLRKVGVDAFFINTDDTEYGCSYNDLDDCKRTFTLDSTALIAKDMIIHPIQIAKALNHGAAGVVLMVSVLGKHLRELLDTCTLMGVEAVVEVHTLTELEYALSVGATILLVNMWDRLSGKLMKDRAKLMSKMIPMNCVTLAAGSIGSIEQVIELGFCGYDTIVLGRNICEMQDIHRFVNSIHEFEGLPRSAGMGMKSAAFMSNDSPAVGF